MQIAYTGKPHDLSKEQSDRLTVRLNKLGKMIDGKLVEGKLTEEKKAHFILTHQRHLAKAEITLHYYGHDLFGMATHADKFRALNDNPEEAVPKSIGGFCRLKVAEQFVLRQLGV